MQITIDPADAVIAVAAEPKEMLSVRTEDEHTFVRINFSSLSMMQECWRKTEYSLIRGLRSNLESPATLFGSAIHKGLEVFYKGKRTERILPKHYKETMEMIGAGVWEPDWEENLVLRAARSFVTKADPLRALPAENKRSVAAGTWILRHYFEQHITDPWVVVEDANGPIVERRFTMPIHQEPGLTIEGFGTIDIVLRNEQTGLILPCDHKTTSQLGPQFYQRLHPNFQYTFYTWATREVLGFDTNSFLVNALQVKEIPKTARGTPPQFARQVTTRTEEDFAELKRAILHSVSTHLYLLRSRDGFPMNSPGPCSNYGGCQYLDICAAPAQLRENIIKARYKESIP